MAVLYAEPDIRHLKILQYWEISMIPTPAKVFTALSLCCALLGVASAASLTAPLTETQIVAASGAAAPTQQAFTIATSEDLVVTLTDLQIPAELASAGVVVTQNGAIVASTQLTAPATVATATLTAASGDYTIYVVGVPGANFSVGSFTACVAPKTATSNCIASASFSGLISAQSSTASATVSTLSTTLTVTTAGSYTFTFGDLAFPTALQTAPTLGLFQGSNIVQTAITSGTAITLSPGTYTLLAIAQADATAQAGLYSISIADSSGDSLLNTAVPVGALQNPASTFANPSAQALTLTVADYSFPTALSSASALLTAGSAVLGTASSVGGAQTVTAPAGTLALWTYGSAGSGAGTYSADVAAGSSDLDTVAYAVAASGSTTFAYAYVTSIATAGAYQATAADLQFPSALSALSFEVAQNGTVLGSSTTAATVNITAAAGNAVVLVSAGAPASTTTPNGLFDVNIQSAGSSATLAFDKTQSVSSSPALFNSQTVTVADDAGYQVTLTDLKFPTAFDSLALVVSRGSEVLGKAFGGGTFTFTGSPGDYQLTFVASPSADQLFGLYSASMTYAPPSVTLSASASSVASGSNVTLTWTAANATSCSASGGNWSGSVAATGGSASVLVNATATYTLTCTGAGGSASQMTTVTATTSNASGSKSGGGALDPAWLILGAGLLLMRMRGALSMRGRSS
jgi:hypothetical protein